MILYLPILVSIILVLYVRIQEKRKMEAVLEGFVDLRAFRRTLREESIIKGGTSNLLLVNTLLSLSTAITYLIYTRMSGFELSEIYYLFGISALGIVGYYWLRKVIFFFMGYFTEQMPLAQEIQTYNKFFYQSLGLVILPIILFFNLRLDNGTTEWISIFYNGTLLLLEIVVVMTYFFKIIQEFRQTSQLKVSGYYLFLYFCTLEILPLVVLFLWFIGRF
ncbi:MAG: DUF4271 domain-containing protein [Flavobacteriales bacterium]|nr:DUF4271 domain-containing protein [Flavobacteriales bacterium]MCB9196822.1 DUF4271 domain-containing protein [Flavobacteriales bacterium]